jgi:hypothetical protein
MQERVTLVESSLYSHKQAETFYLSYFFLLILLFMQDRQKLSVYPTPGDDIPMRMICRNLRDLGQNLNNSPTIAPHPHKPPRKKGPPAAAEDPFS